MTMNKVKNDTVELKETKQILSTVSGILSAQEKVREQYKCNPYDQDFPVDKIKDSNGFKDVALLNRIMDKAEETTPEFMNGLLIPHRLLCDFYSVIDSMCKSVIENEKHRYCDGQRFKESGAMIGATLGAILNSCDKKDKNDK